MNSSQFLRSSSSILFARLVIHVSLWRVKPAKIHKEGVPLRPMVSSIGAVTYHTSKELSRIIKPLVGKSPYHIQNSKEFIFTSVPIQPAITIIKKLLEEDQSLQQENINVSGQTSTCLLEFCLKSTYFSYQGQHYQQLEGAAMGSPISPIVANLFMEDFEQKAIVQLHTHLTSGKDMWMTPLPSWSHHIEEPSWTTSTLLTSTSSLPVKNKEKMGPYHSLMC